MQGPEKPLQRIHMDLAGSLDEKMYFIIVDAPSNWPEVFTVDTDMTTAVISHETMCSFGIPDQIVKVL